MIRILVFLLCMLPLSAFGATYNLSGGGSCLTNGRPVDCSATLSFEIDPSDYGLQIKLLGSSGLSVLDAVGDLIARSYVIWTDITGSPGNCTDTCAFVGTDAIGNLNFLSFASFNTGGMEPRGNLDGWRVFNLPDPLGEARGSWDTITVSAVPLPPALPLFAAVLAGLGVIRRLRRPS